MTRSPHARLLLILAASGMLMTVAAAASQPAPPDLHGPLSDFWPKVRRDWTGRLPGLNHGPLQTFIWLPIIWDGPDDRDLARLIDRLRVRERHNWLRTGATEHRWRDIAGRNLARLPFMRQNSLLIGTPGDNGLVARALAATPLRVDRGLVEIAGRAIRGDNLLLIAIVPNPVNPASYSIVFTGSSGRALLRADKVAYGESDYIVFRGDKVVERGFFEWKAGVPRKDHTLGSQSFTPHLTWKVVDSRHGRLHYDPATTAAARLVSVGRQLDTTIDETAAFFGILPASIPKLNLFLYVSPDEKIAQTGDPRLSHVDPADDTLHTVLMPGGEAPEPALVASILLASGVGIWARTQPMDLPGLRQALSLACRASFQGIPLAAWASRTTRDAGWLPMDRLFYRDPQDLESGDLDLLDAAAFLRDLITREGIEKVARFYSTARRASLAERFRSVFGISLGSAESRWLETIQPDDTRHVARAENATGTSAPSATDPATLAAREAFLLREDGAAERMLLEMTPTAATRTLLARICFRTGRFDQAVSFAREVVSDPGATADDRAWARLTLGRALAVSSRRIAAISELRHDDIAAGSGQPRILADFWLETMGMPLNQRAAHQVIVRQAQVELTNWNWDAAEEKLRVVLAADPINRKAHAMLGQVYLSKYTYWHDYALLDRELFPGASDADPEMYQNLARKGQREIEIASLIPAAGEDTLDGGTQTEEIAGLDAGDAGLTHLMLGKAQVLEGNLDSAVREFEEALSTADDNPDLAAYCHMYLGRIAATRGDLPRARAHFESILGLHANASVTAIAREDIRKLGSSTGAR